MSRNLFCMGKYEVPVQIPTYISYMIWSNNDGGAEGVLFRLEQYFRHEAQIDFNKTRNEKDQADIRERLDGHLADIAKARREVKKNPRALKFGVL